MAVTVTYGLATIRESFTASTATGGDASQSSIIALQGGGFAIAYALAGEVDAVPWLEIYALPESPSVAYGGDGWGSVAGGPTLGQFSDGNVVVAMDNGGQVIAKLVTASGVLPWSIPITSTGASSDPVIATWGASDFALAAWDADSGASTTAYVGDLGMGWNAKPPVSGASDPAIAALEDGDIALLYHRDGAIRGTVFAPNTNPGSEFSVAEIDGASGTPDVAALADGGFAVVFVDADMDGTVGLGLRIFDADGNGGDIIRVDDDAAAESSPRVAVLESGHIVVSYTVEGADGGFDARLRVFDADGDEVALDGAASIGLGTGGETHQTALAALEGGGLAASWTAVPDDGQTRIDAAVFGLRRSTTGDGEDNRLAGDGLADVIEGRAGDDTIGGGAGLDIAVYSGTRADYDVISGAGGTYVVIDQRAGSPDGTDTLTDVELLRFSNATIEIDAPNTAPQPQTIDDRTIAEGTAFSLDLNDYFSDDDEGDLLSFTASDLPSWLTISEAGLLSGTPYFDDSGEPITITITATDLARESAQQDFRLTVSDTNRRPGADPIPDQTATEGQRFYLDLTRYVGDLDGPFGDVLSFSAPDLPSWLALDSATGELSGTPGHQDSAGAITVTVTATDLAGASYSQDLVLTVLDANQAPSGTDTFIAVAEDGAHHFSAADFGFSDPDGDALQAVRIVTMPAAGALTLNGDAVAAGTRIDAEDIGLLVWTPPADANGKALASLTFQVIDDGGTGNGGSDTDASPNTISFDVTPVNDAPEGTDKSIAVAEDGSHSFSAEDFGFSDPDGDALQAVRIVTMPAAGALTLNGDAVAAGTRIDAEDIGLLVWTPPADANGEALASLTFQVIDTGGTANGGTDIDASPNTISFDVMPVNDVPEGTPIGPKTVPEGETFSFDSSVHFSDIDGALTFSASTLPSWLVIDPETGVLSGRPGFDDAAATRRIVVTARDGDGASVSRDFRLAVENVNRPPGDIALSTGSVAEDARPGTLVGLLSADDPDVPTSFVFSEIADPGGKFSIVGNSLLLDGPLDFEADQAHVVTIRASDSEDGWVEETFSIRVTDVIEIVPNEEPTTPASDGEPPTVPDPDDTLRGGAGEDRLKGGKGKDTLKGGRGDDVLKGGSGSDALKGGAGGDGLKGGSGKDGLNGGGGKDRLDGGTGNDQLKGGRGADTLTGGKGKDSLTGGRGADEFAFKSAKDSPDSGRRDTITDLREGQGDRIDLKKIDARKGKGNQKFDFIGEDEFSGEKGELRFEQKGKKTFVYGDVNGDGEADFSILIKGRIDLGEGDFVL